MIKRSEIDATTYDSIFGENVTVFHTAKYHQLHVDKVEKIFYLLFEGQDFKVGLIGGVKDNTFLSPISAPCGGFGFVQSQLSIEKIHATVVSFIEFLNKEQLFKCRIVPFPAVFNQTIFTNFINAFFVNGFKIEELNINHHVNTIDLNDEFMYLDATALKMLKQSFQHGLLWKKCLDASEKEIAYDIIKTNRSERNKPLRLSYQDLMNSCDFIENDFFIVADKDNNPLAAAIVFKIAENIVQVIYWGNISSSGKLRPMNFLAHQLFNFYKRNGISIIDIGISTEESKANFGLCRFKDGIGCKTSLKVVLRLGI